MAYSELDTEIDIYGPPSIYCTHPISTCPHTCMYYHLSIIIGYLDYELCDYERN